MSTCKVHYNTEHYFMKCALQLCTCKNIVEYIYFIVYVNKDNMLFKQRVDVECTRAMK